MKKYKHTPADIERAARYSKNALYIILFVMFAVIVSDAAFDRDLVIKDKIIGILINSSVLVVCYFAGEAYRKHYIKKRYEKI